MPLRKPWLNMCRICGSMAISRVAAKPARGWAQGVPIANSARIDVVPALWRGLLALLLILGLSATSCVPVRPVVKIGLLASFEGLQRRNGYEALAAMRWAITTAAQQSAGAQAVAVIPLALDAGADPAQARRAAQKLLADPTVKAVVGPYDPLLIAAVRPLIEAAALPWFLPFALDPAVGIVPTVAASKWASTLVQVVAAAAKEQGQQRLVLIGPTAGWPPLGELLAVEAAIPLVGADPAAGPQALEIAATDALLWLGRTEMGAAYINDLRPHQPEVPFWLGPWGGDPVLGERTLFRTGIYWVGWSDDDYPRWANAAAAEGIPNATTAYLTYRATEAALAAVDLAAPPTVPAWSSQRFALQPDGTSRQLDTLQP